MHRSLLALFSFLSMACTPTTQRTVGVVMATAGLSVAAAAAGTIDSCFPTPQPQQHCHDSSLGHSATSAGIGIAAGAGLVLIGGIFYVTSDESQPEQRASNSSFSTVTSAAAGATCGAAGSDCSNDDYCAFEAGTLCGFAGAQALCKPRLTACVEVSDPVCGCDFRTYRNACLANAAGTGIYVRGRCPG